MWPFTSKQPVEIKQPTGTSDNELRALSFLAPEIVQSLGRLPSEAIYGFMNGEDFSFDAFRPNPIFLNFMHRAIKEFGPRDPSLQAAAARQREGWVYVIDLRTPDGPQGRVPIEDIVGGFEAKDGRLTSDAYWANEKHLVFSENGLVVLPPHLNSALITALMKC